MILGIDPGRDKIGWALISSNGDLFLSGICPISEQESFITTFIRDTDCWQHELSPWVTEKPQIIVALPEKLSFIAVGNGTGNQETMNLLKRLGVRTVIVDEKETTLEARELYWNFHRLSWWQRYLPRIMRFPHRPLDDLAALIIARRSLLL